jgi:hypothetical protein
LTNVIDPVTKVSVTFPDFSNAGEDLKANLIVPETLPIYQQRPADMLGDPPNRDPNQRHCNRSGAGIGAQICATSGLCSALLILVSGIFPYFPESHKRGTVTHENSFSRRLASFGEPHIGD